MNCHATIRGRYIRCFPGCVQFRHPVATTRIRADRNSHTHRLQRSGTECTSDITNPGFLAVDSVTDSFRAPVANFASRLRYVVADQARRNWSVRMTAGRLHRTSSTHSS